ncbi:MAG TPA: hypothetical protein VFW44_11125, partial [Bryobacteraceae bacterium]|nr:hypothetical protein [Bryobacteraceae bacterium]
VGNFYFKHGDNSAAANRMGHLVEQYPLYSKADLALWEMGESYGRLGNRFRKQEGDAYAKIVRDYPLSEYADDATKKLKELELPVPEPDKAAVARMQYEKDHKTRPGIIARDTLWLKRGPDMSMAAKSGDPAMSNLRPSVPPLVPQPTAAGATGGTTDVTAEPVGNSSALDNKPDARANPPAQGAASNGQPANGQPAATSTDSTSQNATQSQADQQNGKKKKKNKKQQNQPAAAPHSTPASTTPPSSAPSN